MDWNQPPKWDLRRLNQFIAGPDGRKHIVTRFNADRLQGQRTRLGERYYQKSLQTLAVTVPTILKITATGREVPNMYKTWDEVVDEREEITALRAQTDAERQQYLKGRLEDLSGAMMVDGRLIL